MKQKDKRIFEKKNGRIKNIDVGDLTFFDEMQQDVIIKSYRTSDKSNISFKSELKLVRGQIVEIMTNNTAIVRIYDNATNHTSINVRSIYKCSISGRLKQFLFRTKKILAVGDDVEVDITLLEAPRIENVLPRKNTLSRFTDGTFQKEVIIAANVDLLIITVSWRLPMLKTGLIDRYLCLANICDITPIICLNKIDLCEDIRYAENNLQYYKFLEIPIVYTSCITMQGIEDLRILLRNKTSVFSGQSGTGKSSIINCLEPGINLMTNEVSRYNEKGRHTTTQSKMIQWSFGGNLIDTPGLKTVNLNQEDKNILPDVFPGFNKFKSTCYYKSCSHTHELQCAVKEAVTKGLIPRERYQSYLRIRESI